MEFTVRTYGALGDEWLEVVRAREDGQEDRDLFRTAELSMVALRPATGEDKPCQVFVQNGNGMNGHMWDCDCAAQAQSLYHRIRKALVKAGAAGSAQGE